MEQLLAELLQWKTLIVCGVVMLNPFFWNAVSRIEYRTHAVSKAFGGPKRGISALATGIVSFNYARTFLFHKTVEEYSIWEPLNNEIVNAGGSLMIFVGAVLVISSSYRLGFFCSFMGDYFGVLLSERVTGFPFNVVDDPMYWGSSLIYLGIALNHASIVGLLLTGCIGLSYVIGMYFEEPFTAKIYAEKASEKVQ